MMQVQPVDEDMENETEQNEEIENDFELEPETDGEAEPPLLQHSPELDSLIVEVMQNVVDIEHERDMKTLEKNKELDRLKPYGIPRAIAKEMLDALRMTDAQRAARDTARLITRQALGIPPNKDLFE